MLKSDFLFICVTNTTIQLTQCGGHVMGIIFDNKRVNQSCLKKFTPNQNNKPWIVEYPANPFLPYVRPCPFCKTFFPQEYSELPYFGHRMSWHCVERDYFESEILIFTRLSRLIRCSGWYESWKSWSLLILLHNALQLRFRTAAAVSTQPFQPVPYYFKVPRKFIVRLCHGRGIF